MMRCASFIALALVLAVTPAAAFAQRADDNATTSAEDAFGTSIGGEQIGIYNPNYVRGFSAAEAGNIRIDGLYIDQQGSFTDRLIGSLQMRVGLSAQSYPFPAPTGIADYGLRIPGNKPLVSLGARLGPLGAAALEVDAQLPVTERLAVGAGLGLIADRTHTGGRATYRTAAVIARWEPVDGVIVTPFWSRTGIADEESQPLLLTGGDYLPPRIERVKRLGQKWATNDGETVNAGLIGSATIGDWALKAGIFRSILDLSRSHTQLFLGVQADGSADEVVIAEPGRRSASTSGEVRLSRRLAEGPRLHTLHLSVKGRDRVRRYGGDTAIFIGNHPLEEPVAFPEPASVFGVQTRDTVRQWTAGIAYEGRWRDVGEISLGLQKTNYRKRVLDPDAPAIRTTDDPLLFNATAAFYASPSLAFYAGYTQGLEESPVAPGVAVNRDDAPPAIRTRQIDGGVRWSITPNIRVVAGVFDVTKPFYSLDAARIFRQLGDVRHRGAEFSLSGQLAPGLTAIAGTALIDAKLSGDAVDSGLVGRKPLASFGRLSTAVLDYRPTFAPDFSVDLVVESTSDRVASTDGKLVIPARAIASIGGRYRFQIGKAPATVRVQLANIGNKFGWANGSSGVYLYNFPRRVTATLTADFG
ncbi:MAG TPA: TonB-dependent receptor [Sphingopyxis sp.]|uniref:TonB-dependent receptor domain-containing protein n=1 Tax=Sphingopyxis sp. TaxID=1908224 RepID=UPI002C7DCB34|nr:TonB-dependent receptor [Sphingopyxis sp.]HWW55701.1 TonB-dependent receptor [Sphingopyxis sp.]